MLSIERAQFMVKRLEDELKYLEERKEYISKNGNINMDYEAIISRIDEIKFSLNDFKSKLTQMMESNSDTMDASADILPELVDFNAKKEKYNRSSKWNRFITNLENGEIDYQKINNLKETRVRGM